MDEPTSIEMLEAETYDLMRRIVNIDANSILRLELLLRKLKLETVVQIQPPH